MYTPTPLTFFFVLIFLKTFFLKPFFLKTTHRREDITLYFGFILKEIQPAQNFVEASF